MWKGLKDFLLRGSVIELAIAVVIGIAFGQVINSLVEDILMPLIGLATGKPDFSALMIGPVAVGKFLNAVVNFLVVGTAIYFLVVLPMMRFQKKKEAPPPPAEPSEEVKLLRAILEELKQRL
jgi:large conductance mechanosensitive channel